MYQFIHIETYAREASTKTPTKSKAAPIPGSVDFVTTVCYCRKTKPAVVAGFEVAGLTWRKDSNRGNSYD